MLQQPRRLFPTLPRKAGGLGEGEVREGGRGGQGTGEGREGWEGTRGGVGGKEGAVRNGCQNETLLEMNKEERDKAGGGGGMAESGKRKDTVLHCFELIIVGGATVRDRAGCCFFQAFSNGHIFMTIGVRHKNAFLRLLKEEAYLKKETPRSILFRVTGAYPLTTDLIMRANVRKQQQQQQQQQWVPYARRPV